MSKLRTLLVAGLVLPLMFGGAFGAGTAANTSDELPSATLETGQADYQCCWVYHMGRWYCVPC